MFRTIILPSAIPFLLAGLRLAVGRGMIGVVVGVCIAWLIARTNLPCRTILEVGFWIALFMPALPVTLSWVLVYLGV